MNCHAVLVTGLLIPTLVVDSRAADVDHFGDVLPPGAVSRLGGTRLRHSSVIQDLKYSPDGKTLLCASKSIRVWDAKNGRMIREMAANPHYPIKSLSISPDGKTAAFPGYINAVHVLEIATGRDLQTLDGHKPFSECSAFSADGKALATGGRDGTIRFWDLSTGKELRTLDHPGMATYLAYTPGDKGLVSTSWNDRGKGECRLWDLGTGTVVRRWADVGKPTVLSPDGKTLAIGTADYRLRVLEVDTGKELRSFKLPGESRITPAQAAQCAAFSPDGKLLAAGDMTNRVHVWHVGTGKELHCSPPAKNWATSLAFSPDGKTLAVGNWLQILLWDATTGKDLLPLGGHVNQVNRVRFAPDGKTIASWSEDSLILWDPLTGRERSKSSEGWLIDFAPDGNLLVGDKGSIVHWQPATGKSLRTFKVLGREWANDIAGFALTISPDGKKMVSGSNDRTIRMWNLETNEKVWEAKRTNKGVRFPADIGRHHPLGFTQDGKAVVTIASDCVVRFWDAATGKELRWFPVASVEGTLSSDGRFLVTEGKEEVAPDGKSQTGSAAPPRLWDLSTGREPRPVVLYPWIAGSPAFSPDGTVVAVARLRDIFLLERASGKEIRQLNGHQDNIRDLAFAPDGRLLVSGSYDLTALVWDVTGLMRDRQFPQLRLTAEELEKAWADLADTDASKAHQAIWKLVAASKQAVPFLASRLKPVSPVDSDRVARLIGALDDGAFAVRENATKDLENLGELVQPALRKALDLKPSEEARSRLTRLMTRPDWPENDASRLRVLRAVSVLGQVGDTDAQKVLDTLAKGASESRLTQEARASLKRNSFQKR